MSSETKMRVAAAAKWHELGQISQEKAAQVAGLSRSQFMDATGRFRVSPFQCDADEILGDVGARASAGCSTPRP